ncbi:DUF3302 domain-containing protein [Citrobacter freundii]|uniref:DUF3302 domain-containing protein n=1 Tax=Citrobacter freundii TaxID=546 RepID=UPI0015E4AF8C|nr:DUF3302 domain-containing protein [Citrobacter freundii]QLO42717.1 DUF3302 domain-containing protein [Citrobacter freundii]QLV40881.1 DUF3302 domain-containing protein [Citrobacter freundii]
MVLNYIALAMLIFVFLVIFYGVLILHDIPYEIAKKRNHPHLDAIHVAGWVSLFTLHALWPFLWIWATLYSDKRGWHGHVSRNDTQELTARIASLEKTLEKIAPGNVQESKVN